MRIMGINIIDFLYIIIFISISLGVLLSVFGASYEFEKEKGNAMASESPYDIFVLPDFFEDGWAYRHRYECKYQGEDIEVISIVPIGSEFYDLIRHLLVERSSDYRS